MLVRPHLGRAAVLSSASFCHSRASGNPDAPAPQFRLTKLPKHSILNRQTQTENALAHHDESSLNVHLADILSRMAPESGIRAENTGVIRESRGLKPDIFVTAAGRSPVIIEAEYEPASSVEQEAKQRLGLELEKQTRPVEAVVALRLPEAPGRCRQHRSGTPKRAPLLLLLSRQRTGRRSKLH